ncbi:MAG TPA: AAA family ATPase [Thermoanaerobaculaceae bacterium]|nr:AAA family ATPase [Thermoanaerobaculaceae bacterium]HRS15334.1 AAA family ATPase [Thermoanaerobaculaceae bacterium]
MPTSEADLRALNETVREEALEVQTALREVRKVIVGQTAVLDRMMITLLCRGHLLVEGVPGLAKTLAVKTLGQVLDLGFARIQFTPDLLPADLTGTMVYNQKSGEFVPRKGPVFTNLLLADEINRAPAKVQSALLEAMQERQVTIGEATYPLPEPFMVFATQNPIEQEGTYPLPEAQVDRFLLKARIDYPGRDEERQMLDRMLGGEPPVPARALARDAVQRLARRVLEIYLDDRIKDYIVSLVRATRAPREAGLGEAAHLIAFGASPRATLAFSHAARAMAFLQGRGFVIPEDVKAIAPDVLRHRILLTYEAEAENVTSEQLIERLLERVEVP